MNIDGGTLPRHLFLKKRVENAAVNIFVTSNLGVEQLKHVSYCNELLLFTKRLDSGRNTSLKPDTFESLMRNASQSCCSSISI
jgi:hypothetical protein